MTGEVTGEGRVVRMLGVERFDSDGGEFRETGADGRGEVVEAGEFRRARLTLNGWTPGQRQRDPAASRQLQQQGTGGHVFESTGVVAPVPNLSEFLGETTAMPVRVGRDQIADIDEVLLRDSAALNMEWYLHEQNGSMENARESSEIWSGSGASRDLSSYKK